MGSCLHTEGSPGWHFLASSTCAFCHSPGEAEPIDSFRSERRERFDLVHYDYICMFIMVLDAVVVPTSNFAGIYGTVVDLASTQYRYSFFPDLSRKIPCCVGDQNLRVLAKQSIALLASSSKASSSKASTRPTSHA